MFFRLTPDRRRRPVDLVDLYAGPRAAACWILGGGPSLSKLPLSAIDRTPAPKLAVNLAGVKRIRPDFWTAYDPTPRFHRAIYHDARILKLLPAFRATDLVPETADKVCDCPGAAFFDLEGRDYHDALAPGQTRVLDWADSLAMAVDVAYRLGFRRLLMAGCDMRVRPSAAQLELARRAGVEDDPLETLDSFVRRCKEAGVSADRLDRCGPAPVYHFDETKPLAAAVSTDNHYFRISQALRQSRRAFATAGLQIVSVTPGSRLNDYFPYQPAAEAAAALHRDWGDIAAETERGRYHADGPRLPENAGPMKDVPPPRRDKDAKPKPADPKPEPVFVREEA